MVGAGSLFRERSNASSDLLFFGVVLWMARRAVVDARNEAAAPPGSLAAAPGREAASAVVNLIHACGTTWNHACRCHGGHVLDVFGMFSVLSFLSLHKVAQAWERAGGAAASGGAFAAAQAALCAALWPLCHHYYADEACERVELLGFVGSLLPFVVADAWRRPARYDARGRACFAAALGLLLVAFVCQSVDQPRHGFASLCDPESVFQLHAAWHAGTAVAALLVFEAQRSARYVGGA